MIVSSGQLGGLMVSPMSARVESHFFAKLSGILFDMSTGGKDRTPGGA